MSAIVSMSSCYELLEMNGKQINNDGGTENENIDKRQHRQRKNTNNNVMECNVMLVDT